ncbi:DUF3037 domain-containing protein [Pedobacter faecalis]|uniref:DUF3037 domain-containing protein n=1 Tax=Pedobacter faecalis TaxID=3041495 RepID=UPI00254B134E|nr:DUF3037 domain-containing protein [Pedobacter sp. ELA7]
MQERDLFEYAVLRLVPRVEREEFINIGVVLYCRKQQFLRAEVFLDQQRALALCPDLDLEVVRQNLEAFGRICVGDKHSGPIAELDMASRFRWLTATRSTILQASKVHPGLCADAGEKLHQLYSDMVVLR